jgi:chromate transport protein ChrA
MVFSIVWIRAGILPALFAFLLWSLPGAVAMYGLSLGVQKMPDKLSPIVYALLSGMNASTVGIIALAAVQLADKAIKDKLSRILVIFGACAGLCYNSLWYFPVLILIGGLATLSWDIWLLQKVGRLRAKLRRKMSSESAEESQPVATPIPERQATATGVQRRTQATTSKDRTSTEQTEAGPSNIRTTATSLDRDDAIRASESTPITDTKTHSIPIKIGISIIAVFFTSFLLIMVLRGTLSARTLAFDLFANMYLAGTIIFGGGPVVIPLLREYVVQPGWVSPRDFLLGLAIIQALPGPNFNFSVYLGALALSPTKIPTVFGALLGFIGIFTPGLTLSVGVQSLWRVLRTKNWVISLLRGINAAAVGLVFTAVYRLWEIGYLTPESSDGKSLAEEPWWVVVAAVTYAESAWFGVPPALAIGEFIPQDNST